LGLRLELTNYKEEDMFKKHLILLAFVSIMIIITHGFDGIKAVGVICLATAIICFAMWFFSYLVIAIILKSFKVAWIEMKPSEFIKILNKVD
jgi:membrane-bound ClpP family serine protease